MPPAVLARIGRLCQQLDDLETRLLTEHTDPAEAEILAVGWSAVRTDDLDVLRRYALRP
ncbi:hypothetical protein ACFWG6_16185 [Streptomyces erythrochromogenes]|uniref:hypothetical protein n=1 Tax=Streptomyces erythrochromogenes TaxID=285574 RepID=UPI00363798D1